MLSIKTGHDVGYLTNAVAQAREGYYTGAVAAGEPPGLWWGAGAEALGLTGEVDADLMEAVYTQLLDPRDPAAHSRSTWGEADVAGRRPPPLPHGGRDLRRPASPTSRPPGRSERAELRAQAERSARQAVSFIDLTFSAPKSVTVLGVAFERAANDAAAAGDHESAAAWSTHAKAVEDAVMAGATAGAGVPAARRRLLPRRAPRRRRRPLDRRAELRRRAVPPARLARPGPAAARPPGDPQPHPVLGRDVAVAGLARHPHAARRGRGDRRAGHGGPPDPVARRRVRHPARRQGPRDRRRRRRR